MVAETVFLGATTGGGVCISSFCYATITGEVASSTF